MAFCRCTYTLYVITKSVSTHTLSHCNIGPSSQSDVVISADGINEILTFGAGADAPNRSDIVFNITDDDIALEAVERYIALLEVLPGSLRVQVGDPSETSVAILDDDSTLFLLSLNQAAVTVATILG